MSRAVDTVLAYRLLKMLATPINKSDAYNLGVIDANGKKIKEPTTSQEKDSYTILNRFIFKVQKALTKSPDMSSRRLLTFAAALSLLREYKDDDDEDFGGGKGVRVMQPQPVTVPTGA